ncbi:MAG TPA: WYL domain-containing protein [Caulobacteraceae bacterium]
MTPRGFEGPRLPEADVIPDPASPVVDDAVTEAVGQRAFVITYRDHAGQLSERRVVALEVFEEGGAVFLRARCLERQALRAFRVDRMVSIRSGVTGEDLGPPETVFHAAMAHPALRRLNSARATVRYALRALMTVARADGEVLPEELDVVEVFLEMALPDATAADIQGLLEHAAGLAPSFETFLDAVERVCFADPELAERMAGAALTLAQANEPVEADEADMVADMAMILKAHRSPV